MPTPAARAADLQRGDPAVPRLGALVSVRLFVTGQMLAPLLLDSFGLLGVERTDLDPAAAADALAVVAGIVLVVRAQVRGATPARGQAVGRRAGWLLLGLLAGAAPPLQGAFAPDRAAARPALVAGWAASSAHLRRRGLPAHPRDRRGRHHRPDRRRPAARLPAGRPARAATAAEAPPTQARLTGVALLLAGVALIQLT